MDKKTVRKYVRAAILFGQLKGRYDSRKRLIVDR
jgi:hypothetical protein